MEFSSIQSTNEWTWYIPSFFGIFSLIVMFFNIFQNYFLIGNSLAVQWLGLHALTAQGPDSIPGQGTKIPQAARHSQK